MALRDVTATIFLRSREYDIHAVPELERELAALRPGHCIIDFGNVDYMDSTGIAVLVGCLKRLVLQDPATSITFVNLQRNVRKVFEILELGRLFRI